MGVNTMTRRPYHEISRGRVKATIWHEVLHGIPRFNVAFTRMFNDAERWWDAACFQRDDMPVLGQLADDVHEWIWQQSARLMRREGEGGTDGTS